MDNIPILNVIFFKASSQKEPVRSWLKALDQEDRKIIGEDIKLVQFRWPIGMPFVRKMEAGLWEVRSSLSNKRIARVFFTIQNSQMVLLHGFVKKSQKTPRNELQTAKMRKTQWLNNQR